MDPNKDNAWINLGKLWAYMKAVEFVIVDDQEKQLAKATKLAEDAIQNLGNIFDTQKEEMEELLQAYSLSFACTDIFSRIEGTWPNCDDPLPRIEIYPHGSEEE